MTGDEEGVSCLGVRGARRVLVWLAIAAGILWAVGSLASIGISGIPPALFGAGVVAGGVGVLRVEVRATPGGLLICNGLRRRDYPWTEVEGFRIQRKGSRRGVYALLGPDEIVDLPVANAGPLLTSQRELRRVRDVLEEYRLRRP